MCDTLIFFAYNSFYFVSRTISTALDADNVEEECTVTNSETTYPIFVTMGITFVVLYIFAALNLDRIGRKLLICKNILKNLLLNIRVK